MKPNWQKLASLKYAHSSFSSLVQSLLPKDALLRTYWGRLTENSGCLDNRKLSLTYYVENAV